MSGARRPGSSTRWWVRASPRRWRSSCSDAIGRHRESITDVGSPDASALEVLLPQPQARVAGELGVARDDIDLGVVEQRVLVEVGGADREPGVVDDADLRVDVERSRPLSRCARGSWWRGSARRRRRRRRSGRASRGCRPGRCWPCAAAGRRRGSRRTAGAAAWSRGFRRSRATTGTGSRGRSSGGPSAARARRSRAPRTRRGGALDRRPRASCGRTGRWCRRRRRATREAAEPLPRRPPSAARSARRRRRRSGRAAARRRRASRSPRACRGARSRRSGRRPARSGRCPPTNATSSSTITSFSWWQCIIAAVGVELALDLRAAHERVALGAHEAAARLEHRAPARPPTRARGPARAPPLEPAARVPGEALRGPGSNRARDARSRRGRGAARRADRLGHPRQSVGAVDQHLDRVARRAAGRRCRAHSPSLAGATRRKLPVAAQPAHVVMDHRALDAVADSGVEAIDHAPCPPYPLASWHGLRSAHAAASRLHPRADVPALGLSLTRLG